MSSERNSTKDVQLKNGDNDAVKADLMLVKVEDDIKEEVMADYSVEGWCELGPSLHSHGHSPVEHGSDGQCKQEGDVETPTTEQREQQKQQQQEQLEASLETSRETTLTADCPPAETQAAITRGVSASPTLSCMVGQDVTTIAREPFVQTSRETILTAKCQSVDQTQVTITRGASSSPTSPTLSSLAAKDVTTTKEPFLETSRETTLTTEFPHPESEVKAAMVSGVFSPTSLPPSSLAGKDATTTITAKGSSVEFEVEETLPPSSPTRNQFVCTISGTSNTSGDVTIEEGNFQPHETTTHDISGKHGHSNDKEDTQFRTRPRSFQEDDLILRNIDNTSKQVKNGEKCFSEAGKISEPSSNHLITAIYDKKSQDFVSTVNPDSKYGSLTGFQRSVDTFQVSSNLHNFPAAHPDAPTIFNTLFPLGRRKSSCFDTIPSWSFQHKTEPVPSSATPSVQERNQRNGVILQHQPIPATSSTCMNVQRHFAPSTLNSSNRLSSHSSSSFLPNSIGYIQFPLNLGNGSVVSGSRFFAPQSLFLQPSSFYPMFHPTTYVAHLPPTTGLAINTNGYNCPASSHLSVHQLKMESNDSVKGPTNRVEGGVVFPPKIEISDSLGNSIQSSKETNTPWKYELPASGDAKSLCNSAPVRSQGSSQHSLEGCDQQGEKLSLRDKINDDRLTNCREREELHDHKRTQAPGDMVIEKGSKDMRHETTALDKGREYFYTLKKKHRDDFVDPTQVKLDQEDNLEDSDAGENPIDNSSDEDWRPKGGDKNKASQAFCYDPYVTKFPESVKDKNNKYSRTSKTRSGKVLRNKSSSSSSGSRKEKPTSDGLECPECGKVFHGSYHLKRHLQSHTEDRPFPCPTCGKRFKQKAHLQGHETVHLRDRHKVKQRRSLPLKLNVSPSKCPGRPKKVYSENELSCIICKKVFKTLYRLKRHVQSHTDVRPYACKVCGKGFKQTGHRNEHEANHEKNRRKFLCNTCGVIFRCRSSFNNHLKTHRRAKDGHGHEQKRPDGGAVQDTSLWENKPNSVFGDGAPSSSPHTGYDCPYCADKFATAQGLNRHMESHVEVHQRLHVQPYSCNICCRTFTYKHNLAKHLLNHQGPEKYAEFHKSKLEEHLASGKPSFTCSVCLKVFMRKETLAKHSKIHTGNKPFKCLVCSKGFTQNVHMKVHMRKHTGNRPFQCKKCSRGFIDSTALAKHIEYEACNSENLLFHCTICDKRHYYLGSIKLHIKKEHMENDVDRFISRSVRHRRQMREPKKDTTCRICSTRFTEKGNLIRHLKRKHGDVLRLFHDERDRKAKDVSSRQIPKEIKTITSKFDEIPSKQNIGISNELVSPKHVELHAENLRYKDEYLCVMNENIADEKDTQSNQRDSVAVNKSNDSYTLTTENLGGKKSITVNSLGETVVTTSKVCNTEMPDPAPAMVLDASLTLQPGDREAATESRGNYIGERELDDAELQKLHVSGETVVPKEGPSSTSDGYFLPRSRPDCPVDKSCDSIDECVDSRQSNDSRQSKYSTDNNSDAQERISEANVSSFLYHMGLMKKRKASTTFSADNLADNAGKYNDNVPLLGVDVAAASGQPVRNTWSLYDSWLDSQGQIGHSNGQHNHQTVCRNNLEVLCDLALMTERQGVGSRDMLAGSPSSGTRSQSAAILGGFQNVTYPDGKTPTLGQRSRKHNTSTGSQQTRDLGIFYRDVKDFRKCQRSAEEMYVEYKPWLENLMCNPTSRTRVATDRKSRSRDRLMLNRETPKPGAYNSHSLSFTDTPMDLSKATLYCTETLPGHTRRRSSYQSGRSQQEETVSLENEVKDFLHLPQNNATLNSSSKPNLSAKSKNPNLPPAFSSSEANLACSKNSLPQRSFTSSNKEAPQCSPQDSLSCAKEVSVQTPLFINPSPRLGTINNNDNKNPSRNGAENNSKILHSLLGGAIRSGSKPVLRDDKDNNNDNNNNNNNNNSSGGAYSLHNSSAPDTSLQLPADLLTQHPSFIPANPMDPLASCHVTTNTSGSSSISTRRKSKGPFPCQGCGKCFNARHQLKRHEMTHSEVRPYRCSVCGKAFRQKVHLSDHLKRHRGQRPFQCSACGKRFVLKNELKQHVKNYCRRGPPNTTTQLPLPQPPVPAFALPPPSPLALPPPSQPASLPTMKDNTIRTFYVTSGQVPPPTT